MAIRGIFTSHSNIVGDRVGDLSSRVLMHMPQGTAPLLALSSGMPKKPARDVAFSWVEDAHISGASAASGTVNAAATEFDVEDSNLWTPQTILLNTATDERMLVTGVTGNTITVIRGISNTTADAITDGDLLHNIGTAFAEGSGKPFAVSQRGHSRTGYVQIFKNGWAITGTAQAIAWHTGSQLAMNQTQAMSYHVEDIEKAFLFGKQGSMIIADQMIYLASGVISQVRDFGGLVEIPNVGGVGNVTMTALLDYLRRIFLVNVSGAPNERIAFTSSKILQDINTMARMDTTYNISQGSERDTFGFTITTIRGINGSLKLMTHPLFETLSYNSILILHPQFIAKRELRPIENHTFGSAKGNNNGIDATEGHILSHLGFEVGGAKTMGIYQGITTPLPSFA